MKKVTIRNQFNYIPDEGEYNSHEVLTVPDESYTIQEILDKFTKGIPLNIEHDAFYSDTEDFDEVDEISQIKDLTDIGEALQKSEARKERKRQKQAEKPVLKDPAPEPAEVPSPEK